MKKLKSTAQQLPTSAGVYLFKGLDQQVVYVGKAKNLRKRVTSYSSKEQNLKNELLVGQIAEIEYSITPTEIDALVLEDQLIRKYQPRFNILLKHDSSYRYICITRSNPPQISTTRKILKNQICLGPFPFATHEIVKVARDILGLTKYQQIARDRWQIYLDAANFRKIQNQQALDAEIYHEFIQKLIKTIKHGDPTLINDYQQRMLEYAKKEEFEQALEYKHKIELLNKIAQRSSHKPDVLLSEQLLVTIEHQAQAWIFLFQIKHGLCSQIKKFVFNNQADPTSLIDAFVKQYYTSNEPPALIKIYSSNSQTFDPFIAEYLKKIWQKSVKITQISANDPILKIALPNIQAQLNIKMGLIPELQALFGLKLMPEIIDFVDISNLSDQFSVGGVVRFTNGQPTKSLWRHYIIKTITTQNDYASITETVQRRYQKISLPDVLVVDGGIGQLNAALKGLPGKPSTLVVSLAKREETLIFPTSSEIKLNSKSAAHRFIIRGRDAVHQFVIKHSRATFQELYKKSWLDQIPGIGINSILKLIKQFGDLEKVKYTTLHELTQVLGPAKAKLIVANRKSLIS